MQSLKNLLLIKNLQNFHLCFLGESNNNRELIDNYFLKGNVRVSPIIEVSTTDMMIDFVKRDMGVGYFVEDAIDEYLEKGTFVKLELKNELPTQEVACAYIDDYLTVAAKKFIELFGEYGINMD